MKRALALGLVLFASLSMLCGCPKQAPQTEGPVTVDPTASTAARTVKAYVPCGLIVPIREAIARFEEAHPDISIEGQFDNAITNALKIKDKGERPDLFIAPGDREMQILQEAGLLDEASKTAFAQFELVVVTPRDNPKGIESLQDLTKADVITMPNPDRNSIGMYGKQALDNAGLWETLMPKGDERIVLTDFPISAYEKVAAGRSEAALMYRNCPMKTDPEKLEEGSVAIVADVDKSLYDTPLCTIAAVKDAPNPDDAKTFISFLIEPDTQALLAENGLTALGEAPDAVSGEAISVVAYYPDNEGHAAIKKMILELEYRYAGKVQAEFVDFTSDEGYKQWRAAGLNCGAILIDGEQTFTLEREDQTKTVTFMMGEGGEWTRDDLYAVLDQKTGAKK